MYFHYFVIISTRKMAGPFIWTNLNLLHPRILCAKFGPVVLEKVFKFHPYIFTFVISPLGKGRRSSFVQSPSLKDALYQVWLNLAQWFWRRRRKCEKFMTMTPKTMMTTPTDKLWSEKLTLNISKFLPLQKL